MSKNNSKKRPLPRPVFQYIEHELANYKITRQKIEILRDEITSSRPDEARQEVAYVGGAGGKQIGRPTEGAAIKLTSSAVLMHMESVVRAIDKALSQLTEDHNEIFQLRYIENKPWQQIVAMLPVSQDTYFRKRRELVWMVAIQLGLMQPGEM